MLRALYTAYRSIPLLVVLLLLTGCDVSDAQREFEADAAAPPAGITPTDADGNVVGTPDPDDWRSSPLFPSVTVLPAYPNPVPFGFVAPVTIEVSIPFTNVVAGGLVLLAIDNRPLGRFAVVLDQVPPESVFTLTSLRFTRSDLQVALNLPDPRGLYRLIIRDGSGRLISYGDVRIE